MYRARTLVIFLVLAGLLGMARPPATIHGAGSLTLPPGFVDETVVSGLTTPRAFVFAPDGRIFIAERGRANSNDINFASIRVFKNGALLSQRAISFDVCGDGERGFLGMALDPNFASNGYIYVYYTRQANSGPACAYNAGAAGPRNRVSRVTMTGDTAGDERVLVDNMPSDSGIHNSGDLHFGLDGNLYITAGDGGSPPSPAQNLASLGGKMLRIRPTAAGGYTIPDDNPFKNTSGARLCGATPPPSGSGPCQEIFAYGLRNPFRFTIQPGSGVPFAFDVGGGHWEEIDRIVNGGNYGYALREGPCPAGSFCTPSGPSGYEDPIYSYAHDPGTGGTDNAAVIGGAFYSGTGYPAEYQGNLFFGDFVRGWIKRLVYNSASDTWSEQPFATGGEALIGFRIGLDTNLYYLEIGSDFNSKIHRIRYEQDVNQPPVAQIAADPLNGPLNTVYTFSAVGSSDPEQGALTYNWDLGDGTITSTSVPTITHQYATPGVKTITLTVTDDGTPPATSAPAGVQVFPGNDPPSGTIALENLTAPGRADRYYAGDTWRAGAANLADDQTQAGDLRLMWTVEFHHREHMHPFVPEAEGAQEEFTIPPIGETDPVVWYRVILRITDVQSQTTTIMRDLFPSTATITLTTDPVGGQIALGGGLHTAPYTTTRVVGINDQIGVPSPQTIGGAPFRFAHWSNGQPQEQTITVPPAGETYTAVLLPEAVELPERRIYIPLVAR